MSIRFAELPANCTGAWQEEAAALRANPGVWAHFEDKDGLPSGRLGTMAYQIKNGKAKAFRDGKFEARVINSQLWVRFVGDES